MGGLGVRVGDGGRGEHLEGNRKVVGLPDGSFSTNPEQFL